MHYSLHKLFIWLSIQIRDLIPNLWSDIWTFCYELSARWSAACLSCTLFYPKCTMFESTAGWSSEGTTKSPLRGDWREPDYHLPSSPPSTEALWRASWTAASLCGLGTATHLNAGSYNAWWGQPRRSKGFLCPSSTTSSWHAHRAISIMEDPSHPSQTVCTAAIRQKISQHQNQNHKVLQQQQFCNSFPLQAIRHRCLNTCSHPPHQLIYIS